NREASVTIQGDVIKGQNVDSVGAELEQVITEFRSELPTGYVGERRVSNISQTINHGCCR
ncbi:hypothetical protein ACB287_20690, partial [Citrobacter freundii]